MDFCPLITLFTLIFYSHLKNFTARIEQPASHPNITGNSGQIWLNPAPWTTTILKAVFRCVVGKALQTGWRKEGIWSRLQKQPPRNIKGKRTAMHRVIALLVFLTRELRTKPSAVNVKAPRVNTIKERR